MTARIMGWKSMGILQNRHLSFECYGACVRCKGWGDASSRQWEMHFTMEFHHANDG